MIEVCPELVTPLLVSLFDPQAPAVLRCFGVLAGVENGKIFTDNPLRPKWSIVWEATDGTLYLGGAVNKPIIRQAISMLRLSRVVRIGLRIGDPLTSMMPPSPDDVSTVLEFLNRPLDTSDLSALVRHLPPKYKLRRMNRNLLEDSLWFDVHSHGSVDTFLTQHLAVCLMHRGTILCEASTSPSISGVRELGVITREDQRGRGFATSTCAYLIQLCAQVGDCTYWNCDATNFASASVARKLGYRTERSYQLLTWSKAST